jgi:molecular chaperone DnaK
VTQPVLVVDLGAYSTVAAVVVGDRALLIRDPLTGAAVWPSALSVDAEIFLAGGAAERARYSAPGQFVDSPRRALDTETPIVLADRELDPTTALSAYLGSLRDETFNVCGEPVDRLTLTVPVSYQLPERRGDLLIAAAEAAGFREVELVGEARAAIMDAQATTSFADGSLVLVCDLGDTWTTALMQLAGGEITQLAQETSTAGRDLDARLFDDLRVQAQAWLEPRLAAPGDAGRRAHYEALDYVRTIKHRPAAAHPDRGELVAAYELTEEWLNRLAEPGLRWVVGSCRSLLARAAAGVSGQPGAWTDPTHPGGQLARGTTLADVSAVVLVGGHARLSSAERIIQGGLGRPVLRPPEPDLAVVRGAVRWASGTHTRRLIPDHPKWRVEPLTWNIPGGRARLVRWSVSEGQHFPAGAVLAQVRTPDERVFDLTAPDGGVLISTGSQVGELVGPTLIAALKRPASTLAGDPPDKRWALSAAGEWLLTPDRRLLVECGWSGRHVKLWSIPDAHLVGEFRPDFEGQQPHQGRVFVNPRGRLSLVAWDPRGSFSVFDVQAGRRVASFRDANAPLHVMVNEREWLLTSEAEDGGAAGRYRRSVATVWDLATGRRVEKLTDDRQRRLSGYKDRSAVDGFGDHAFSPDGRLHAVPVRTAAGSTGIALQESASDQEVFRAEHPSSARVRMAFTADGQFLLTNWESDQRSQVDVWEL